MKPDDGGTKESLAEMVRMTERSVAALWGTVLGVTVCSIPAASALASLLGALHGAMLVLYVPLALIAVLGSGSLVWQRKSIARLDELARRADDVRDIPALIGLVRRPYYRGPGAAQALAALLPKLDDASADILGAKDREWFELVLSKQSWGGVPGARPDLTIPVLQALAHVGSLSTVGLVRIYTHSHDPQIAAAATASLMAMEDRLTAQRDAATLLRPASGSGENTLLRPAGYVETDEALLVRPAAPGDAP